MKKGLVVLIIMTIVACAALMISCSKLLNQSAVSQVSSETSNPLIIAKAAYFDAISAYVIMAKTMLPYNQKILKSNPELHDEIIQGFTEANEVLEIWKKNLDAGDYLTITVSDFESLRGPLSIKIAEAIEAELSKI